MTQPAADAWSYSGDPSSGEIDELRFLIQDTDPNFRLLADHELQYLIDMWLQRYDSLAYVGSVAAAIISRKFAGIVNVSADGVSVNTADLAERYREMAENLRDEYRAGGVGATVNIDNVMIGMRHDPSIQPLVFGMRLHDNPAAGQQDYGGWAPDPFEVAERVAAGML